MRSELWRARRLIASAGAWMPGAAVVLMLVRSSLAREASSPGPC